MTKQKLQAELKDKVKPGIKPSHLKRSKSLGDLPSNTSVIPQAPLLPTQQVQQLQQQLVLKDQEIKELKKHLEKTNQDWTNLATKLLDNLKENTSPLVKQLQTKLYQTVKDATEEINRQENKIKQLRTKLTQTTQQNQDLTKQVNEYQRAAELRITESYKEPNYSAFWEDYGLIILCLGTYCLSIWMLSKTKPTN